MRSPSSIVFGIVFPLIFILVFGFMGGSPLSIDIAIASGSDTANPIFHHLSEMQAIHFVPADENTIDDLDKGRIDGYLHITKNQDAAPPLCSSFQKHHCVT